MTESRWQIWLSAALGLWVFVSPWMFGNAASTVAAPLTDLANWNLWIAAAAVAVLSLAALVTYRAWEEWTTALLGIWLVASPWIFGFSEATAMTWNTAVAGGLLVILGGWAAVAQPVTRRLA